MPSPAKVRALMAETRARRVAILAAGIALAGALSRRRADDAVTR